MKIKVRKEVELLLNISLEEAKWLRDYFQNPPQDFGTYEESELDEKRREHFFTMLDKVLRDNG